MLRLRYSDAWRCRSADRVASSELAFSRIRYACRLGSALIRRHGLYVNRDAAPRFVHHIAGDADAGSVGVIA